MKASVAPNWYPLNLPHTWLYDKSPILNMVEEQPDPVYDRPHVLLEYDVKLSPIKATRLHPGVPLQVYVVVMVGMIGLVLRLCLQLLRQQND